MKKSFGIIVGIMLLGAGTCLAQSEQPSLAELAKQNKAAHKGVKTFTEADLPAVRANATDTTPAAPAARVASGESSGGTGAIAEKKDNAKTTVSASKDSPAIAEIKKQINSYQQDRDVWRSSAKRYEDLLANETNDFRRQMYQDAIENDKKNIVFYQQKIDQAQSDLAKAERPSGNH